MNISELRCLDKQLTILTESIAFSSVTTVDTGTAFVYTLYYNKV